jgi:hypothetical protein
MEWQVVTVLVVLIGLLATIVKPMLNLNTSITRLTDSVDTLIKNQNKNIDNVQHH